MLRFWRVRRFLRHLLAESLYLRLKPQIGLFLLGEFAGQLSSPVRRLGIHANRESCGHGRTDCVASMQGCGELQNRHPRPESTKYAAAS
jgi:hypothetical protein